MGEERLFYEYMAANEQCRLPKQTSRIQAFVKVKVQDQLKAVGVETVDSDRFLRKMADIDRVMNNIPTAKRIAFAEGIFNIRGWLAGLSPGSSTRELKAFIAKPQDIGGTAPKNDSGDGRRT